MADEERSILSPENRDTIIASGFVLALLSMVFGFYNYTLITRSATILAGFDYRAIVRAQEDIAAANARIDALEAHMKEMKKAAAAPPPAAAPPAAPAEGGE